MTNAIRRAFDAGTRDSTGRPGPNYWQLQTDYTINVSLDPATQTLTGHRDDRCCTNNSPRALAARSCCGSITTSSGRACRSRRSWVPGEITDGMVITKLAVNGEAVDLARRRRAAAAARGAAPAARAGCRRPDLDKTVAHDHARRHRSRPKARRRSRSPGTRNCRAARAAAIA